MFDYKPIVHIKDWAIVRGNVFSTEMALPENFEGLRLVGISVGHPHSPGGALEAEVHTTVIEGLDSTRRLVMTKNTLYKLGPRSSKFAEFTQQNAVSLHSYQFNTQGLLTSYRKTTRFRKCAKQVSFMK